MELGPGRTGSLCHRKGTASQETRQDGIPAAGLALHCTPLTAALLQGSTNNREGAGPHRSRCWAGLKVKDSCTYSIRI